jgi:hypothetical protein
VPIFIDGGDVNIQYFNLAQPGSGLHILLNLSNVNVIANVKVIGLNAGGVPQLLPHSIGIYHPYQVKILKIKIIYSF